MPWLPGDVESHDAGRWWDEPILHLWWDGAVLQPAELLGWWDGAEIQSARLVGWWDGAAIRPFAF